MRPKGITSNRNIPNEVANVVILLHSSDKQTYQCPENKVKEVNTVDACKSSNIFSVIERYQRSSFIFLFKEI